MSLVGAFSRCLVRLDVEPVAKLNSDIQALARFRVSSTI